MDNVEVLVPVDAETAAELADDPIRLAAVGRLLDLLVRPTADNDPLLTVMRMVGAEAAARGLTPELLEAELAAHKAERTR